MKFSACAAVTLAAAQTTAATNRFLIVHIAPPFALERRGGASQTTSNTDKVYSLDANPAISGDGVNSRAANQASMTALGQNRRFEERCPNGRFPIHKRT
jgi:hypothetical protein